MGANCRLGVLLNDGIRESPQYRVVRWSQNPFKLCDFPLVTLLRLLY
jgi:hypothetical protein